MHCDRRRADPNFYKFETILGPVAIENQILHSRSSLEMLVLSLQDSGDSMASKNVFEFLDNCILRLVRKPIHYSDIFSSLLAAVTTDVSASKSDIDLLLVTVMEQWPFLAKSADPPTITNVSAWLLRYMEMTRLKPTWNDLKRLDGADTKVLRQIRDKIRGEIQDKACRGMFQKALKEPPELGLSEKLFARTGAKGQRSIAEPEPHTDEILPKPHTELLPPGPPQEDENHPGLNRWSREDIQDAISDGPITELFLCLCSEYAEIRKQALHSVRTFMGKLEVSSGCDHKDHSLQYVGVRIQRVAAHLCPCWRARGDGKGNSVRWSPSLLCRSACSTTSLSPRRPLTFHVRESQQVPEQRAPVEFEETAIILGRQDNAEPSD